MLRGSRQEHEWTQDELESLINETSGYEEEEYEDYEDHSRERDARRRIEELRQLRKLRSSLRDFDSDFDDKDQEFFDDGFDEEDLTTDERH